MKVHAAVLETMGATHPYAASRPLRIDELELAPPGRNEAIRESSSGGVETAIEMTGSTRAFEIAYRITRRGGTTIAAGLPPPDATWGNAGRQLGGRGTHH